MYTLRNKFSNHRFKFTFMEISKSIHLTGVYIKSHVTFTFGSRTSFSCPLLVHWWWLLPPSLCWSPPHTSAWYLMSESSSSLSYTHFLAFKYYLYANYSPIYHLPQTSVLNFNCLLNIMTSSLNPMHPKLLFFPPQTYFPMVFLSAGDNLIDLGPREATGPSLSFESYFLAKTTF